MKERPAVRYALVVCLVLWAAIAAAAAQDNGNPPTGTGWLGVLLGDVRQATEDETGANAGVRVRRVMEDGPAMKAGFRAGDVIKEVDGTRVNSTAELIQAISGLDSGAWITMKIDRRGKSREIRARLDGRPEQTSGLKYRNGYVGIKAIDLPEALRAHFGAPEGNGVMVSFIDEGSPAQVSGLELGDLVFEVDGEPVRSSGHLRELLGSGGVGNELEIRAMRGGLEIVVEAAVIDAPEQVREQSDRMLQEMRRRRD
jgi:S1-C subfamily serine protease